MTAPKAVQLAKQIRDGDVSAREVVEAHIRQVEAVNPLLNAIVVTLFEQAGAAAAKADEARRRGDLLGPLHGVPITIKEMFDVAGTPTTAGCTGRATHVATEDAPLVARLRQAGAIILGKTNVPLLGACHETTNPLYGRTNNPWSLDRSPGGSSGGEAAIIAAGGSPLGLGSDIGGSIRQPAHSCGICGIKPTSGRLTMRGHAPIFPGQEAVACQPGPLARSVADLALALAILAAPGQENLDPRIPPIPLSGPSSVSLERLRIAFYDDDAYFRPAPALRRAVREAAAALEIRGAIVEEWQPPDVEQAMRIYWGLLFADGGAAYRQMLGRSERDRFIHRVAPSVTLPCWMLTCLAQAFQATGQHRLARAMPCMGAVPTHQYWKLVEQRNQYRARFLAELEKRGFDAIVCPPDALPALRHGSAYFLDLDVPSYQQPYNLLGMPAGAVAVTRVRAGEESDRPGSRDIVEREARRVEAGSAGLPVGVQVVARHWREEIVLAVMEALEGQFRSRLEAPMAGWLPL